jgi:hypothetical protein
VTPVDVDRLRGLYELHNSAGADFPALLARDYLVPDAEFVEFAAAPGAMRVEDLELTALDEHTAGR